MKKINVSAIHVLKFGLVALCGSVAHAQTNPLFIPPVLTGTTFNLSLNVTNKQFFAGATTVTYAYNSVAYGGPTLIMNKGDTVQINLTNNLQYSTTFTAGSWVDVGSVTSDGTAATFIETDPARLAQPWGYYRVTLPIRND